MPLVSRRRRRQISTWVRHLVAYKLQGKARPRVVFIHVPKTGGVSVGKYFRSCFGLLNTGKSVSLGDTPWYPPSGPDEIARANHANFVGGHVSWAQIEQLDSSRPNLCFTFLRAPVGRMWSIYNFITDYPEAQMHPGIKPFLETMKGMSADAFFTSSEPMFLANADNYMVRQLATSIHAYPVAEEAWPALVAKAKANLAKLDFVGFQESFDADFRKMLEICHLPKPRNVPHMNRSVKKPRTELSPEAAQAIARLTKWDREIYDFARTLRGLPQRAAD